jgi:negative regulator of flagellin synthesis FlgM
MKISTNNGAAATTPLATVAAVTPLASAQAMGATGPSSGGAALQSAVMGPALAAMAAMPEIDHAKVAELRDAIARGELQFDAGKLAGLIQRFHGGQA